MFGDVLKELRKREGLSQAELAEILGVSKSTVGMYEQSKRSPHSDELLMRIAGYFGVTIDYLKGYAPDGVPYDFDRLGLRKVVIKRLPMLGKIACGKPVMCEQDYETVIDASGDINADFCVTAEGDSMINARIMDGDIIFVREQSIVENGEIAVVIVNDDEVTLKRFYYYPESQRVILQAENPKYQPMVYEGEQLEHIRVLGKAVAFNSKIR
ncbi:MAG: helix-turn-helix domain-containing protein [Clostridia bacterium]|nr:helix-turn-helix domain-containing protein [Clostridia bacterium]